LEWPFILARTGGKDAVGVFLARLAISILAFKVKWKGKSRRLAAFPTAMRFPKIHIGTLATALFCAATAHAQTATPPESAPAANVPAPAVLSVSLPPNARLRFDLDAQDEDVLGVVKSLLRGFNGARLKDAVRSLQNAPSSGSAPDPVSAGALAVLSDADLQTMLENVHHLRVVAFETPRNYGNARMGNAESRSVSVLNYYQAAYIEREGGRRVMRADFDDVQLLGVGFQNRGFALVVQAPGLGFVMRADGYPNLESVGPLATAAVLFFSARSNGMTR